ncbi:MBL fold metallo-hydrolase [Devosia sp. ZW T5_3]|uniref:MBL fold metallo-hydrolase n=1 Tax=Devosia sp. ZW T5_3 TaxID=3378085 RepID=UPI0038551FB4
MSFTVADHWFECSKLDDDITLIWEPHVPALLRCNIWHVRGRDRDLIIDTGLGISSLRTFARDILDKPVTAVATHTHIDHIGGHHEFDECLVHRLEADGLCKCTGDFTLAAQGFTPMNMGSLSIPPIPGYDMSGSIITAIPSADFDIESFCIRPSKKVVPVEDGDVVDLGDRAFRILHLPGHSPGSIGLFEERTQTLFSGDALYDGPLISNLHHSDVAAYRRTLQRLLTIPARTVHAGHDPSFDRERLVSLAENQLRAWDELDGKVGA